MDVVQYWHYQVVCFSISYLLSVILLDCDRMLEKTMLKIFQARISSSMGMCKRINEVWSAWSLMDEISAKNTDDDAK